MYLFHTNIIVLGSGLRHHYNSHLCPQPVESGNGLLAERALQLTCGDPSSDALLVEYVTLVAIQLQDDVIRLVVLETDRTIRCGRLIETVESDTLHSVYEI